MFFTFLLTDGPDYQVTLTYSFLFSFFLKKSVKEKKGEMTHVAKHKLSKKIMKSNRIIRNATRHNNFFLVSIKTAFSSSRTCHGRPYPSVRTRDANVTEQIEKEKKRKLSSSKTEKASWPTPVAGLLPTRRPPAPALRRRPTFQLLPS